MYDFKVTWMPYLLRPNMPKEGVEKPAAYGPNSAIAQRLVATGRSVGVEFSHKSLRLPYTISGHCALEYALLQDPSGQKQNELQESLFKSYFTDGDILSEESVASLASSIGFDKREVLAYIRELSNVENVKAKAAQAAANGVRGVPAFIMNGKMTFSGAQEPENFTKMFETVLRKQKNDSSL